MDLLNDIPADVLQRIRPRMADEEEILIGLAADMDPYGNFASTWVVATRQRLLVVPPERPSPPGTGDGAWFSTQVQDIPLAALERPVVEPLVGCWRLVATIDRRQCPLVYFSGQVSARFTEAAWALEQLVQRGEFAPSTAVDEAVCRECGRTLPELGGACPRCVSTVHVLRRLVGYLRPYRKQAITMAACAVLSTLLSIIPPLLVRELIDRAIAPAADAPVPDRLSLVLLLAGLMLAVRFLMLFGELGQRYLAPTVAWGTSHDIRAKLFRHLEFLSLSFYDRRQVGAVMSRLVHDGSAVQGFLSEAVPFFVNNCVLVIGILAVILWLNPLLAVIVLVPAPILGVAGYFSWQRMRRLFDRLHSRWSDFTAHVNESLAGIRVTKALAQENRQIQRFAAQNKALSETGMRVDTTWGLIEPVINFVLNTGTIVVWAAGGYLAVTGKTSLGDIMAFMYLLYLFYTPMQWFARAYQQITRAVAGAERIFDIIDTPTEAATAAATPLPRPLAGHIQFEGVSFGYDKNRPVLNDLTFEIQPGEMVGLVGRSGAGKSTTIKLLCRFHEPDRGRITIDGVDLAEARLTDLREQIGLVPQDPFLFGMTIAENIAFGRPDASLDQIIDAARAANAHGFISQLPDGYDFRVGEGGQLLSAGQRQRLSIARALLRDPRLLILDEATSSVDTETERLIQEAIERLIEGRTTVAIAHRLSTLRHANRLIVLEQGQIREMGTHDALLSKPDGTFSRLVRMQQDMDRIVEVGL